jgi:hypothetical protein
VLQLWERKRLRQKESWQRRVFNLVAQPLDRSLQDIVVVEREPELVQGLLDPVPRDVGGVCTPG